MLGVLMFLLVLGGAGSASGDGGATLMLVGALMMLMKMRGV